MVCRDPNFTFPIIVEHGLFTSRLWKLLIIQCFIILLNFLGSSCAKVKDRWHGSKHECFKYATFELWGEIWGCIWSDLDIGWSRAVCHSWVGELLMLLGNLLCCLKLIMLCFRHKILFSDFFFWIFRPKMTDVCLYADGDMRLYGFFRFYYYFFVEKFNFLLWLFSIY